MALSLNRQLLEVRAQADQLLGRLHASQEIEEQVAGSAGDTDPIRIVTGRSAIEQAIDSTTDMITQMDRLIGPRADVEPSHHLVETRVRS